MWLIRTFIFSSPQTCTLMGAAPSEMHVRVSHSHLQLAVQRAGWKCVLNMIWTLMIEFRIASPRVQHWRCKNEIASCHQRLQAVPTATSYGVARAGSLAPDRGR